MTAIVKKVFPVFLLLQLFTLSVIAAEGDRVQIREDAPSRYVVVRGDTLWDISGRFLEDPWLWPEVWELNPQIENPHLIYPGDIVALRYTEDGPLLTLERGEGLPSVPDLEGIPTIRMTPEVRRESLGSPIPAIPLDEISAFLNGSVVISREQMDDSPYLLGSRSGKIFSSDNDVVFAKGDWPEDIYQFDLVRPARDFIDPESGNVVGVEGRLVGSATMVELEGLNATLQVTDLLLEARVGDRFIPAGGVSIESSYFPEPPAFEIEGRIIDILSGRTIGSLYDTLVINKGSIDGLQVGDLLGLQKPDVVVPDQVGEYSNAQRISMALGLSREPSESFSGVIYGSVLIYRLFEETSFGIILSTEEIVRLEDKIITP